MINRRNFTIATALSLAVLAGPALADHVTKVGDISIEHPWSRKSPMGADVAAGFMVITNTGKTDDKLISGTAEIAHMVQIHDMKMDGDVMKMFEIPGGLVIPAGGSVELKPKSKHIMFMHVMKQPDVGATFKGSLTFEKAGTIEIVYDVKEPM